MDLFNMLLSDWVGRLSLFTVVFATGMIIFLAAYFTRQVIKAGREAEENEDLAQQHDSLHHT
ncbi:MAG: DUF3149 domain-containing protein [Candidatus Competibacteraceae bacterium]|nr:DUF3149 domain-containing protein [Candidatus Competibacteraceae bacterium]